MPLLLPLAWFLLEETSIPLDLPAMAVFFFFSVRPVDAFHPEAGQEKGVSSSRATQGASSASALIQQRPFRARPPMTTRPLADCAKSWRVLSICGVSAADCSGATVAMWRFFLSSTAVRSKK